MNFRRTLLTTAAAGLAAGAAATAAAFAEDASAKTDAAMTDGEWVHLTGTVTGSDGQNVGLDYGDGVILVELDDQDAFNEAKLVSEGDRITVRGRVDADFAETKSVEADTVFVHDRGVLFRTSYADDEPDDFALVSYGYARPMTPETGSEISLSGEIEEIEDDDTFFLDAGAWDVRVDVSALEYEPFADGRRPISATRSSAFEIEEGDRVRVSGVLEDRVFTENTLAATSIVRLHDASEMDGS